MGWGRTRAERSREGRDWIHKGEGGMGRDGMGRNGVRWVVMECDDTG